jgi:hypothetical protein
MKQYVFHGMQRSGNHAIINWALGAVAEKSVLINDFLHPGFLDSNDGLGPADAVAKAISELDPDVLVCTVEDSGIEEAKAMIEEKGVLKGTVNHVLVMRDPFNLFASRARGKVQCQLGAMTAIAVETWKDHARAYLKGSLINANFNIWFLQRDYRLLLARRLALPFTDETKDGIMDINGGSSFDGLDYAGKASEMKVLERYKQVDTRWLDGEVHELHHQIFHTALAEELKELPCNPGN